MDKKQLIEETQKSVEQMKLDDIEDNPDMAFEEFQCACCGENKILAGSMIYEDYRLCNDCVLMAEASFALKRINHIDELILQMEDKRFEKLYDELFNVDKNSMN